MPRKPQYQRERLDIKRGRVDGWIREDLRPDQVAESASYAGSGKHKRYPAPNLEWTPIYRSGTAECDQYANGAWKRIEKALKDAIRSACVQWEPDKQFSARAWAFVNNILHEARLSNPERGEYHAFPLPNRSQWPDDPHGLLKKAPNVEIALH
jgi:hypothetical protein